MYVYVTFVGMDCEIILILFLEIFLAQFLADFQSSFGSDLPRFERHCKVLGKYGILACAFSSDRFKISACLSRIVTAP